MRFVWATRSVTRSVTRPSSVCGFYHNRIVNHSVELSGWLLALFQRGKQECSAAWTKLWSCRITDPRNREATLYPRSIHNKTTVSVCAYFLFLKICNHNIYMHAYKKVQLKWNYKPCISMTRNNETVLIVKLSNPNTSTFYSIKYADY